MKQAIYYFAQRVLFGKHKSQLIFLPRENQHLSLINIPFSSEILSTSSPVMRMCCCTISY